MTTPLRRVALLGPFTPREGDVVELLARDLTYEQVGQALGLSRKTVARHADSAAKKIPGTLPAKTRIVLWYRGVPAGVLG